jgi:hypothetical protein
MFLQFPRLQIFIETFLLTFTFEISFKCPEADSHFTIFYRNANGLLENTLIGATMFQDYEASLHILR